MQIREIVLYGENGKVRHLPFQLGKVNIITGKSISGKSAVGDIIDYCLGGKACNIADGVIRNNVAWYGLLLQFDRERILVARKNPEPGQHSTGYCYVEIGESIEVPDKGDFVSNENVEGLESTLSSRLGITENLNIPPEGQTRNPLAANIRHALYYCFQNQDEIAAKNNLFHKQSDDFITQAIKDTMPYFLGVVNEKTLELENERSILKRKLTLEKRKLDELLMIQGGGLKKASSLISEAIYVGLLPDNMDIDYQNFDELYGILMNVDNDSPVTVDSQRVDVLISYQSELEKYQIKLERLNEEIMNAKILSGITNGYTDEVEHQKDRLSSIGLFEKLDFRTEHCPLCYNKLENPLPNVEMIKLVINNLDRNIKNVTREKPKLRIYLDKLELDKQQIKENMENIKAKIEGIYKQNNEANNIKDLNSRRAKVAGRISLWLESITMNTNENIENIENNIKSIEMRLNEINDIMDLNSINERKQSSLSRISVDMTEYAKELNLEHSKNPYRLDMNKATVVVDKSDRPVPLKQLGSGSNWVGIHIITYFALQKYFINVNRPVPNFIFLDQPSQVYFPSELDEKKTDWNMVNTLYDFIINRVEELNGKLQVIIVDHANFKDKRFQELVIEDWWHEKNLIPLDWYSK